MGRQATLLVMGIAGFWAGGVLPSALLAFPAHWGVQGLWLGLNIGTVIVGRHPPRNVLVNATFCLDEPSCF